MTLFFFNHSNTPSYLSRGIFIFCFPCLEFYSTIFLLSLCIMKSNVIPLERPSLTTCAETVSFFIPLLCFTFFIAHVLFLPSFFSITCYSTYSWFPLDLVFLITSYHTKWEFSPLVPNHRNIHIYLHMLILYPHLPN